MLGYLIRRILLFVPTLLGATFVIFSLMALAPISITDVLLPPTGDMKPGARAEREAYIEERYGLDKPFFVQYLRWLNNVSPIGFQTYGRDDAEVRPVLQARRDWREQTRAGIVAADPKLAADAVTKKLKATEKATQSFGPLPGQIRWDRWPIKVPSLGYSYVAGRPVEPIILEALPVTLLLNAFSLPIYISIALVSGVWAARHRGQFLDWGVGSITLMLSALPVIWVGVVLIGFLANVNAVNAFPAGELHDVSANAMTFFPSDGRNGYLVDTVYHLFLPVVCLSYGAFAFYSKLTRTSVLECLGADYVRTARAKGLSDGTVLWRHAFRNSLIPLITVAAAFLPALVSGSIIIETIFTLRGMGRLVIESLYANDRELFLSVSLLTLILQLVGFLLADIAYVIADPRVSYGA